MADVKFEDFTIEVMNAIDSLAENVLDEVAGLIESQTKQNSKVGKGKNGGETKNSWTHHVKQSDDGHVATIGSPKQNAIWEEFGTGEYALEGNGRKGYWVYVDDGDESPESKNTGKTYTLAEAKRAVAYMRSKGLNAYYTNGKKPRRAFWKAYTMLKNPVIKHIQDVFKGGIE